MDHIQCCGDPPTVYDTYLHNGWGKCHDTSGLDGQFGHSLSQPGWGIVDDKLTPSRQIWMCIKTYRNLPMCIKTYRNLPICIKTYRNVPIKIILITGHQYYYHQVSQSENWFLKLLIIPLILPMLSATLITSSKSAPCCISMLVWYCCSSDVVFGFPWSLPRVGPMSHTLLKPELYIFVYYWTFKQLLSH